MPKDKVRQLCQVVSMPYEDVYGMTLEPIVERIMNKKHLNQKGVWPWVVPTGERSNKRVNGLHFCPKCLEEPPVYFKKQWRLSWNVACPIHGVLLQLHCPNCFTVFSPHLIDYRDTDVTKCQNCGYDLKDSPCEHADKEALAFQEGLNHAVKTGDIDHTFFPVLDTNVQELFATIRIILHFFHKVGRCHATQKVGQALLKNKEMREIDYSGNTLESVDVKERHFLMMLAARLFRWQPDSVIRLLAKANVTQQMLYDGKHDISPTVEHILNALEDNARRTSVSHHMNKKIEPNNKETVEAMMDEIRKYL